MHSWFYTYLINNKKTDILYIIPSERIDLFQIYFIKKKRKQRTGFTEISSIHTYRFHFVCDRFVPSFISTCCSVCLASSLGWLCIHLYCCQFERKEKILFRPFIITTVLSFPFVWQPCIIFSKKKTSDRQVKFIITQQSLSLFIKHIHLHYEILLRPADEKERERKERFENFKTKKKENERIKERIKKVTSVPSSNTLSLSSLSFSLLPTNKVA